MKTRALLYFFCYSITFPQVEFEKYQVHVLASVLKCFLREMPEPLLTFECYENFITAANLEVDSDRVATLYDILKKLPPPNYDLMERLMFHLARVALHEETNRMSAASLAIVFAPCVLRTNKVVPAQESLVDIGSQTRCIETIIGVQLRKIRSTLEDIDTLDTACQAATNRLSSLRNSKVFTPDELLPASDTVSEDLRSGVCGFRSGIWLYVWFGVHSESIVNVERCTVCRDSSNDFCSSQKEMFPYS